MAISFDGVVNDGTVLVLRAQQREHIFRYRSDPDNHLHEWHRFKRDGMTHIGDYYACTFNTSNTTIEHTVGDTGSQYGEIKKWPHRISLHQKGVLWNRRFKYFER